MLVGSSHRSFLGDKKGELLGVGRTDLFADQNVGERLIAVDKFGIVGGENILVDFSGKYWGVFQLWQHTLRYLLFL